MGQDARQTVAEIERTREDLARKVDELVDRARAEATVAGKKAAIAGLAIAGLFLLSMIAKRRVNS